jgi:hypothetical protein
MKRLVVAFAFAVAAAALAAPAVSSSAGKTTHPAKQQTKLHVLRAHDGPCPFASQNAAADL